MLCTRIMLGICFIKFIVMAFMIRKEGKAKKAFWFSLGAALFWLILFTVTFFIHI